jgi:hypothetical protein
MSSKDSSYLIENLSQSEMDPQPFIKKKFYQISNSDMELQNELSSNALCTNYLIFNLLNDNNKLSNYYNQQKMYKNKIFDYLNEYNNNNLSKLIYREKIFSSINYKNDPLKFKNNSNHNPLKRLNNFLINPIISRPNRTMPPIVPMVPINTISDIPSPPTFIGVPPVPLPEIINFQNNNQILNRRTNRSPITNFSLNDSSMRDSVNSSRSHDDFPEEGE